METNERLELTREGVELSRESLRLEVVVQLNINLAKTFFQQLWFDRS